MLGIPLRYLLRHPMAVADLAAHPAEVWTNLVDLYVDVHEARVPEGLYQAEDGWEEPQVIAFAAARRSRPMPATATAAEHASPPDSCIFRSRFLSVCIPELRSAP